MHKGKRPVIKETTIGFPANEVQILPGERPKSVREIKGNGQGARGISSVNVIKSEATRSGLGGVWERMGEWGGN